LAQVGDLPGLRISQQVRAARRLPPRLL